MCLCRYACMFQELFKNHNQFLVCLSHLANKADSDYFSPELQPLRQISICRPCIPVKVVSLDLEGIPVHTDVAANKTRRVCLKGKCVCMHMSPYCSSWLPIPYSRVWVLAAVRLIYPIAARWVWQRNWHHRHECGPACGSPAQQRCLQRSLRFLSRHSEYTHTVWSLKLNPLPCTVGSELGVSGFMLLDTQTKDSKSLMTL